MNRPMSPSSRDQENPDPQELNRPIPRILPVLVALLLAWAVFYIVEASPGIESSSVTGTGQAHTGAAMSPSD